MRASYEKRAPGPRSSHSKPTARDGGGRLYAGGGRLYAAFIDRPRPPARGYTRGKWGFFHLRPAKHIEGTNAAEKLLAKGDAAHVFTDLSTLAMVENAIYSGGKYTGTITRGATTTQRFGLWFDSPIGARIGADGARTSLFYGEATVGLNGLYHVMPRTGPAK